MAESAPRDVHWVLTEGVESDVEFLFPENEEDLRQDPVEVAPETPPAQCMQNTYGALRFRGVRETPPPEDKTPVRAAQTPDPEVESTHRMKLRKVRFALAPAR